jgi:caffeoyl-CoA O-methyltransferase
MEKRFGMNDPKINDYVEALFQPEDDVLKDVRRVTEEQGIPLIQVGPMDGRHLSVLASAIGAKKAVEVGTLTGYSGISLLRGMGSESKLYTFEVSPEIAAVANDSFKKAGLSHQVEVIVGPASNNLSKVEAHGPFDLVFLDADKAGYVSYFKWAEKNIRVGGIILADNTFAWGKIAKTNLSGDPEQADVQALQAFNRYVSQHSKFSATILPTGEGLTLAVKVSE